MTITIPYIAPENKYRHSLYYLLLLFLITIVAYWPLSFHVLSLKNDALNYFLPVRHLVSESYHNNILPLWTPYLNLGYPLHGDMQSGVWNPIVQLFSFFGPYTLYTLQLETLLYIYLGGAGMFFLLKHYKVHPTANLLASVAYMLCGFNSDSAQFLNWIAGTAFLPFAILFYSRCLEEKSIKQGIYTGIALFLLFTCAYPADFILTAYVLAAMLIYHLVMAFRDKKKFFTADFFVSHLFLAVIFLVLSSPAILSYYQSLPLTERGSGASYSEAMSNSLHPALLSSYTTPLSIWKMPGVDTTDPLERNSYIGLAGIIILIAGYFIKFRSRLAIFSKWAVIIFLLFSLGKWGGLRSLAYYVMPLMNSFRHPANARMFTIFFSCLLVGFSFDSIIKQQTNQNSIKKDFLITLLVMLTVLIYSLFTPFSFFSSSSFSQLFNPNNGTGIINYLKEKLDAISFADITVINTLLQLPFFYLLYKFLIKKFNPGYFLITAIINGILFTFLFLPFTAIKKETAIGTQKIINSFLVQGYPLPNPNETLEKNSVDNEKYLEKMGCLNLYNKKIGRSDYRITPSNLLLQNSFWFDEKFRNMVMRYPLIYKADFIAAINDRSRAKDDTLSKWAFIKDIKAIEGYSKNDSVKFNLSKFEPNRIELSIKTNQASYIVLLQNYYPRWKVTVDGELTSVENTNISFMGFRIPGGEHKVVIYYEANDIRTAFIISLSLLSILLIYIVIAETKKRIKPIS